LLAAMSSVAVYRLMAAAYRTADGQSTNGIRNSAGSLPSPPTRGERFVTSRLRADPRERVPTPRRQTAVLTGVQSDHRRGAERLRQPPGTHNDRGVRGTGRRV